LADDISDLFFEFFIAFQIDHHPYVCDLSNSANGISAEGFQSQWLFISSSGK